MPLDSRLGRVYLCPMHTHTAAARLATYTDAQLARVAAIADDHAAISPTDYNLRTQSLIRAEQASR